MTLGRIFVRQVASPVFGHALCRLCWWCSKRSWEGLDLDWEGLGLGRFLEKIHMDLKSASTTWNLEKKTLSIQNKGHLKFGFQVQLES